MRRDGKILVLFAIILPALLGVLGVVVDSGLLTAHQRQLQNIADAAVTTAAMDILQGQSAAQATTTVVDYVRGHDGLAGARVQLNYPPRHGRYASNPQYVELEVERDAATYLVHVLGGPSNRTVSARAVGGFETSTSGAAITVLNSAPHQRNAGLDLAGNGTVDVAGAVLVNTEFGALDEDGSPAGKGSGAPFGVRSNGELIVANDLRVAGGVDDPRFYQRANLTANQLPVKDPLEQLTPPTVPYGTDRDDDFGGVQIPSAWRWNWRRQQQHTLDPGTYNWIHVSSGRVTFRPGIYRIRSVHPLTGVALNLHGGDITANGVLFYIEKSTAFPWPRPRHKDDRDEDDRDEDDRDEDEDDDEDRDEDDRDEQDGYSPSTYSYFPNPAVSFWPGASTRSVVINVGYHSNFSPLQNSSSPYDGLFIFQDQHDHRTIEIYQSLSANNGFGGIVYAKSGHVSLTTLGICRASFVVGTMRINAVRACSIEPLRLLPPAEDVYLVE